MSDLEEQNYNNQDFGASNSVNIDNTGANNNAPCPQNYLVLAIISTVCCCLPLGIVAIIFAAQVNSKYEAGDYQGAMDASNKAKLFTFIAIGLGIIINGIYFLLQILLFLGSNS